MITFFTYLLPATMDAILPAVFFMAQIATAQRGASVSTVANFIAVWAGVYMVSSFTIGRFTSKRNAAWLMIASALITAALSVAFACTTSVRPMYVLMALEGVGMALFFTPFQIFMKQVGEGRQRTLNASIGLYTFAWSLGFAAGPFAASILWDHCGWRATHLTCAAAALGVAVLTWMLKHEGHHRSTAASSPQPPSSGYSQMPDLAWMGWIFSGLGCLALRLVYALFPSSAAGHGLSTFAQGLAFFLLSGVQACMGMLISRASLWMYRPLPVLGFGLLGVVGLCLFGIARTPTVYFAGAICFGIYSGSFFFYFVFHSLVHPAKSSQYLAVNEATVGLVSLLGPFMGGLVADHSSVRTSHMIAAAAILIAVAVQASIHTAYRTKR